MRRIRELVVASAILSISCGTRTGLEAPRELGAAAPTDASVGAADAKGGCRDETIATDANGAAALAVDDGIVFWGTPDGRVQRWAAGASTLLATVASDISSLAFDPSRVYFTSGGVLQALPRGDGARETLASKLGRPVAMSIDRGVAFVLDYGSGIAAGRVLRIDPGGAVLELARGFDVPTALAVDDESVYVVSKLALVNQAAVMGPLMRIPKSGGQPTTLVTELKSPASLASYRDRLYFIEQVNEKATYPGALRSISKQGGPVATLTSIQDELGLDLAVDVSGAYWTAMSTTGTSLNVAALDGSGSKKLVTGEAGAQYVRVRTDSAAVYWTIQWSQAKPPRDRASVRKHCK